MRGRRIVLGRGTAAPHHAGRAAATWAVALLVLGLLAGPAAGQVAPVAAAFNPTQSNVPAEATAENAVRAREQALASGRRIAWERLVAQAGIPGGIPLSDAQIEQMVRSIVIEQERVTPTRYAGRITVNFDPRRARGALGSRAPAVAGGGGGSGGSAAPEPGPAPASTWVEAIATYRSMGEWLEIRRRLAGAAPVAEVSVQGIAVDRARLRLALRGTAEAVATELPAFGLDMVPVVTAVAGAGASAPMGWRLGLAGHR